MFINIIDKILLYEEFTSGLLIMHIPQYDHENILVTAVKLKSYRLSVTAKPQLAGVSSLRGGAPQKLENYEHFILIGVNWSNLLTKIMSAMP